MARVQELEWKKAQSIEINVELVSAAKTQLKFLAAVDRNRWLYEGTGLDRAIDRYNSCWLPLLAKHSESPLFEGPLIVPLDCEWVWHCHRLNPVRYKKDCEELYGKILNNQNVVSSLEGISTSITEEIWRTLFSSEPYQLDMANALKERAPGQRVTVEKSTDYDLILAAKRQSPFFYQVSRPHMHDTRYIEGAVARYKGFLHLIKQVKEKGLNSFSVPTYDIDLVWHTHQLHPVSYCNDLQNIMGRILEHDDTDSDRSKGQKLDVGFSTTTKTFEEMYGARYWRAGAMYRGTAYSPVRTTPYPGIISKSIPSYDENQKITVTTIKVFEVMLEFVAVRNLPDGHKGSLLVSFSKTKPDMIFNAKRSLTIYSESGEKQVASFQCQPTGNLCFELVSTLPSSLPHKKSLEELGTGSISLEDFLSPDAELVVEKWLELRPCTNTIASKLIGLRVAISVTVPASAPHELHMIPSRPIMKNSCLFPLPLGVQFAKSWRRVLDEAGNVVLSLEIRDLKPLKSKKGSKRRVVVGIMESGKTCNLAEFSDSEWSVVNSPWSLQLPDANNDDGHLLELTGPKTVRLYPGGRLDYERKQCQKHKVEQQHEAHLITAVEFSAEYLFGSAIALIDLKSGDIKVKDEWFVLPGVLLTFILADEMRREGRNGLVVGSKFLKHKQVSNVEVQSEAKLGHLQEEVEVNVETAKADALVTTKGGAPAIGGCGGGSGGGCGDAWKTDSGGCGGCGAGGCGTMAKNGSCGGGCGGGCSGGCGTLAKSGGCGGCGGGCGGGGCGNMAKSSGCGGGCGSGCGNMVKLGGCSGCGAGGCGAMEKSFTGAGGNIGQPNAVVSTNDEIVAA